jgi:hypothetical protein
MITLLESVRAVETSEAIRLVTPSAEHVVEVLLAGPGTFTSVTVNLEGSVSGAYWEVLDATVCTASNFTNGGIISFETGKLVEMIRATLAEISSGALATASLTAAANPASGETVDIGGTIYKFQTANLASEGCVIIGGSSATSIINLRLAINGEAGFGTLYNATAHADVTAATAVADILVITAQDYGADYNAIALTGSGATLTWSGANMDGGTEQGRVTVNYTPYPSF